MSGALDFFRQLPSRIEGVKESKMKEWLQIPYSYSDRWEEFVRKSLKVSEAEK